MFDSSSVAAAIRLGGAAMLTLIACAGCERPAPGAGEPPGATPAAAEAGARVASPASSDAGARPVDAETLPYADVNEHLVYGYFAFPSDMVEPLPAMILVHDWWGLDDQARDAANRLAAAGYMVLAVDLYDGETVTEAAAAREKTITLVENPKAIDENIRQALDFVDIAGAPSVGIAGWGVGGGYALNAALVFPGRIDAAVIFYGQVPADTDRLATLEAPVLGLFGADDRTVTAESAQAFAAATNRLGKPAEIEIYPEAGHGFADPRRRHYAPDVAATAWQRMLDFLDGALTVDDDS